MGFLATWAFCFATLLVSVVGLYFLYEWRDSNLGLMSWGKELALAAVASAMQAGVYWVVIVLSGRVHYWQHFLGFVLVMICYRVGHLLEMTWMELLVIVAVQAVFMVGAVLALLGCNMWPAGVV